VHFPVRHFHVQPGNVNIIKAHIQTLNLNPTVAVKITDYLSAGAGLDLMYFNFDLKRVLPLPLLGPQTLTLEGDTWGLGGNLGLHLKPRDDFSRHGLRHLASQQNHCNGYVAVT
jgi:long-chain fatty acid transport protein